jgi:CRP/FNR family transcriptional regulator, nitrogen fixation regulation protein
MPTLAAIQITSPDSFTAAPIDEAGERLAEFELAGPRAKYTRNEVVFSEGDDAEFVYRVLSGAVRIYRLLADGRRQIDAFCLPGDLFGLELGSTHRLSAEAVVGCELIAPPRQTVVRHMAQSNDFAQHLWKKAAGDLARARDHILLLGRKTAMERVAPFLLEMADRSGGNGVVTLPMARNDIADYLGLTIETVSRTLTQLASRAAVQLTASRCIALRDPGALRRLNS